MLILTMAGMTVLFLVLTVSFFYTRFNMGLDPIKPPIIFLINTIVLLGSSYFMLQAIRFYKEDSTHEYVRSLWLTLLFSSIFLVGQYFGWTALLGEKINFNSGNGASYLYLLSGLHFLHVIAGIPFLIQFIITSRKKMKEPVSVLVYFSDPAKRLRLRLLNMYWHFLDILWIFLVCALFVMYWFG